MRRGRAASPEQALLADAARAFLGGMRLTDADALGGLEWHRVLALAEEERLAPLLYTTLRGLPAPPPILDRLRAADRACRRQYLLAAAQLGDLLDAFEREGVPVIPLKGPALAEALYPDPALRPFTDLDLLVGGDDLPRALALLSARGYDHLGGGLPLAHELAFRNAACFVHGARRDAYPIDLHWALLDYPGGGREDAIDLAGIWTRSLEIEREGRRHRALSPEDLLVYLAVHLAVHHALTGLLWQLDLALVIRRYGATLDWEAVIERARRWRVAGALYFALRIVEERLAAGPPRAVLEGLRPRGARAGVIEWLRRGPAERLERLGHVVPLLLLDRPSDLLWALARSAVPSPRWARSRYSTPSLSGAYLAHMHRLTDVVARAVRG